MTHALAVVLGAVLLGPAATYAMVALAHWYGSRALRRGHGRRPRHE